MILIDYSAIAISSVIGGMEDMIEEGLARHSILNTIRLYRSKYKDQYGEVVICCDGPHNWRKEVFPQYKHKRKNARKESKIDWNELYRCTDLVLQEIRDNFPYKVVAEHNSEADDIIGAICASTQEFGAHEEVMIISGDKDFVQLQKWSNIHQFSPSAKKELKEERPRAQLLDLILGGDTSDGIPNVLNPDNTFVDEIRQKPLRAKIKAQLIQDPKSMGDDVYNNMKRNKKLIDLCETPDHVVKEILYTYKESEKAIADRGKVFPYLVDKRCRVLLDYIEDFI